MNWNAAVSGIPTNPANFLVAALYDPSAPLTPFQIQDVPKPGGGYTGAAITITFTGLAPIVYNFKLFESTTAGVAAGTVMSNFSLQPSANTSSIRSDNFLLPDITAGMVSGGTAVVDTSLAGWVYDVFKQGYGLLIPGTDYSQDVTGGWHLLGGQAFANGDVYTEHFQPLLVIDNTPPNLIKSCIILTGAATLTSGFVGQEIILQSAGTTLPVTLPPLSSVTDNQMIMITSQGGLHINSVISCSGSDKIQFWTSSGSQLVTKIILGQIESAEFFKYTNPATGIPLWYIKNALPGVTNVGEVIDKFTKGDINTVFADGSLLSRTVYARLFDYLLNYGSAVTISEATWANTSLFNGVAYPINEGFFTMGDGSTTFRVPRLYSGTGFGTGFLRAVDGSTRLASSFQVDRQENHKHLTLLGTFPGAPFGNTSPTNRSVGKYNGTASQFADFTDFQWVNVSGLFIPSQKLSYENNPVNVGIYKSIRA